MAFRGTIGAVAAGAFVVGMIVGTAAAAQTFVRHGKTFKVGPNPTDIVAEDLNGDGIPDIVTADVGRLHDPREEAPAHNQLSLLVAAEALRYVSQPQLRTGFGPYCVAVANLDGSKGPDLVAASFMASRNNDLTLLRNLGENLFEPIHFSVSDHEVRYTKMRDGDENPIFTAPGLTSLAVEDFDGDGYRDVVATAWSSDALIVWRGAGETYLSAPTVIDAAGGPRDIEAMDIDKDGKLDLGVVLYSRGEVGFWKGDGTGAFVEATRFSSRGRLPQKIEAADLNGDGLVDIVVSHSHADDSVVIFYGDGGFSFSVAQELVLGKERGAIEAKITDVVAGDLNGDGRVDLAAACHDSKQVVVFINTGDGGSGPTGFSRETYSFEGEARPRALCIADFNVDGKPDLGVALWQSDSVALLINRS